MNTIFIRELLLAFGTGALTACASWFITSRIDARYYGQLREELVRQWIENHRTRCGKTPPLHTGECDWPIPYEAWAAMTRGPFP